MFLSQRKIHSYESKVRPLITLFGLVIVCTSTVWAQGYSEDDRMEFASQLLAHAEYQSAASNYENFIGQFPRSALLPHAYIGAGDSHFFMKEAERAMDFYKLYENHFPHGKDIGLVLLREAQCLYLNGKTDKVIAKLSMISPDAVPKAYAQTYYFTLAMALMDRGRLKEAGSNFEKVIEKKSSGDLTSLAYLHLADIFAHVGDVREAVQLYNYAIQSGDSMQMKAKIEMMEGLSYLQDKEYDQAALIFHNIFDGYPDLPEAHDAAVNWFIALLKSHQTDTLLLEYDQRFRGAFDDPANGPLHILVADVLLSLQKDDEALLILDGLIAAPLTHEKTKHDAVLRKAKVLARKGQYDKALKLITTQGGKAQETREFIAQLTAEHYLSHQNYNKAWEMYAGKDHPASDAATPLCGQARIRYAQGQNAKSAELFMECFNKAKDESYRQEALYSAFVAYKAANLIDAANHASNLYHTHYPKAPHSDEMYFSLAQLYSKNKKYDQAVDILKGLTHSSSYAYQREALFEAAYNLQLAGHNQQALALYQIIINQNTEAQLTLMSLKNTALLYAQKNNMDKAAVALDTIVNNFPANDLATKDYLWLIEHWKQKNNLPRMLKVIAAVEKRPMDSFEARTIQSLKAEALTLEKRRRLT